MEFEQGGKERAEYGEERLKRRGKDLSEQFGRGLGWRNLFSMRAFYRGWEPHQMAPGKLQVRAKDSSGEKLQTASAISHPLLAAETFPLPSSHYVRLMTVPNLAARRFYEEEAIKGG
ncbi:DUF1016 N-terminal domain-containing protein [Fimbriiglobus ruber]|uniref:DUF1016 N-terminal domain-containing protein n=1 Tax=Fimbriiglobus ruber TaxID=1908690 RepID=UPI001EE769A4